MEPAWTFGEFLTAIFALALVSFIIGRWHARNERNAVVNRRLAASIRMDILMGTPRDLAARHRSQMNRKVAA